jgi:hypothetical protein
MKKRAVSAMVLSSCRGRALAPSSSESDLPLCGADGGAAPFEELSVAVKGLAFATPAAAPCARSPRVREATLPIASPAPSNHLYVLRIRFAGSVIFAIASQVHLRKMTE